MNAAEVINQAKAEGIQFALSPDGKLKLRGDSAAIDSLLPAFQEHKEEILIQLQRQATPPAFCTGQACHRFEEIDLPRRGLTGGCIFQGKTVETWRPLHRMTACPAGRAWV